MIARSLFLLAAAPFLLTGCGSTGGYSDCCAEDPGLLIEDMRAEIVSVRCRQDDSRTDINLLEERLEEQQLLSQTNLEILHSQLTGLQKKVQELEGQQQAALTDIRELGHYAKESATALTDVQSRHSDCVADISNIKGAMESLASLQESAATEKYKVVSGDTLEKIARKFNSTIGAIKEENGLQSDRIYAGQVLNIP